MHSKYYLYLNEKEKNQILIGRRPVKLLNTYVTKCHVTSEILNFFPDNGTDHEELCKPLLPNIKKININSQHLFSK